MPVTKRVGDRNSRDVLSVCPLRIVVEGPRSNDQLIVRRNEKRARSEILTKNGQNEIDQACGGAALEAVSSCRLTARIVLLLLEKPEVNVWRRHPRSL